MDEDDVRRLDVSVHVAEPVQFGKGQTQRQPQPQALRQGERLPRPQGVPQRLWDVVLRPDILAGVQVVPQLHHIIKVLLRLVDAHVEHVHKTFVGTRNGLEPPDAGQLAKIRGVMVEIGPEHDFHRPVYAQRIAGDPDLAITAPPDAADELVVGDDHVSGIAAALAGPGRSRFAVAGGGRIKRRHHAGSGATANRRSGRKSSPTSQAAQDFASRLRQSYAVPQAFFKPYGNPGFAGRNVRVSAGRRPERR